MHTHTCEYTWSPQVDGDQAVLISGLLQQSRPWATRAKIWGSGLGIPDSPVGSCWVSPVSIKHIFLSQVTASLVKAEVVNGGSFSAASPRRSVWRRCSTGARRCPEDASYRVMPDWLVLFRRPASATSMAAWPRRCASDDMLLRLNSALLQPASVIHSRDHPRLPVAEQINACERAPLRMHAGQLPSH